MKRLHVIWCPTVTLVKLEIRHFVVLDAVLLADSPDQAYACVHHRVPF